MSSGSGAGVSADTDALVRRAIAERRLVRFGFHGAARIAEPHDYGVRNGSVQLLVYQVGGQSRSGKLPNWRWITVAEIEGLALLDGTFAGGRATPTGAHSQWDVLFARVAPAARGTP
ncbi:MAG TPA: hypothetical protein VHJ20_03265 [Polyangia bacterium]|nr:hypothetical protein [Polyangia bacterium]